jgi:cell division protein FtsI/penicillin-binding protein 2
MGSHFRRRTFIVAAAFIAATLVLSVRLYALQVSSGTEYRRNSEAVRTRSTLLFPPRARILDARGLVLADSETVWDVQLDVRDLTDPAGLLARAAASPEMYPPLERVAAFMRDEVEALQTASMPAPAAARRFFTLWALRKNSVCDADRRVVTSQLARLLGVDERAIAARVGLVYAEVDAIAAGVGDVRGAERAPVQKAYSLANAALTDPEYWERIRRFPKSVALEPVLEARAKYAKEQLALAEAVLEALDDQPDLTAAYLGEAKARARARVGELAGFAKPQPGPDDPVWSADDGDADADSDLPADGTPAATVAGRENLRMWQEWLSALESWVARPGSARDAVKKYRDELDGSSGIVADVFNRLEKLRDQTLKPHMEAYKSRWARWIGDAPNGNLSNPLVAARRVDRRVIEALKLNSNVLRGVEPVARTVRRYPLGHVSQLLLGHTRQPDGERLTAVVANVAKVGALDPFRLNWFRGEEDFAASIRGSVARQSLGVSGVEGFHELQLAGVPGARVSFADARGNERSVEGEWAPVPSDDLRLALDAELMDYAASVIKRRGAEFRQQALQSKEFAPTWAEVGEDKCRLRGAIVVMDVQTGAVLALLSFDEAELEPTDADDAPKARTTAAGVPVLSLNGDGGAGGKGDGTDVPKSLRWTVPTPYFPIATAGAHAPGSVFKILSAIAMLEEGAVNARTRFDDDQKSIKIGGTPLKSSHMCGTNLSITDAICRSSNHFFEYFSQKFPGATASERYENGLYKWARAFGFGQRPNLDIEGLQNSGTLARVSTETPQELAYNCIGQGAVSASPLQVCRFMAAVATKGRLCRPHLSAEANADPEQVQVSPTTWKLVHQGMREVVASPHGTARRLAPIAQRIRAAGKTGTAQAGTFTAKDGTRLSKPDHSWFAGFAPFEQPRVAFVVLAEYSGLQGAEAADIGADVVEHYLTRK